MDSRIKFIQADITTMTTDAIVNASKNSLLNGDGVNGAIHKAAGPKLLQECIPINGCETGDAKMTSGYLLKSKHVIHTVGPVWKGGTNNESVLLKKCYISCLELAVSNGTKTISFPSISTGIFGYPFEKASEIALFIINNFLATDKNLDEVWMVSYSNSDHLNYLKLASKLTTTDF